MYDMFVMHKDEQRIYHCIATVGKTIFVNFFMIHINLNYFYYYFVFALKKRLTVFLFYFKFCI